jgi:hypothetical protein
MFGYRKYNTILYYVIYFANRKITLRATRHAGGVTRLLALLWLRQEFPEAGASGYAGASSYAEASGYGLEHQATAENRPVI